MLNLFTILVFLFVLLGVLGLRAFTNRARREEMVRERLTELLTQVEEEAKSVAPVEYPDESVLMGLDDYHGHFPRLHARIVRIQKGLELLGWTKNLRLRVLVLGALSFTAAALVGRMTDYPFLIAFFGGAALFASAAALLYLRAMGEWTEELGKSLPEAIDSIARICRAGVPAQTAFGLAAQNLRGALSEELRTIDRWLRLGVPLKQVLQESAHRVPLPEYRFFAVIVIISQDMVKSPFFKTVLHVKSGKGMSLFTAAVLLGIMILPTIITVSKTSLDAVPDSYYEGSLALGATHERSVFYAVLPAAKSGVLSAVILGIGRAIGETMAVVMVAGNQTWMPKGLFQGLRTMTSNIVIEMGYAADLHREALIATGVVLFVFILLINLCFSLVKGGKDYA